MNKLSVSIIFHSRLRLTANTQPHCHNDLNSIRATKAINDQELKLGVKASWHDDYKDSAYVYIGGLDTGLTEGDIITIFSQYGEPVDINLPKEKAGPGPAGDKPHGGPSGPPPKPKPKSRGFCFLMYENQLSTNLAVDNLNGAAVLGRTLRVDHCKNYKQLERSQEGKVVERDADLGERLNARPELHVQLARADDDGQQSDRAGSIDPEDPMAAYLLEERRKRRKDNAGDPPKSSKKESKKHKRRGSETEEERAARKDAKRIKKLLKDIGPSKPRDHDRRDEARDSRKDRSPRGTRHDSRDRRHDRSPRSDQDRYNARDDRGYRRSDRER